MVQYEEKEYLTPDEAAAYLGVVRRTLDRYASSNRIRRYRRGITRSVFFKRSELDQLLAMRPKDEETNT